jgi:hypothetical protein
MGAYVHAQGPHFEKTNVQILSTYCISSSVKHVVTYHTSVTERDMISFIAVPIPIFPMGSKHLFNCFMGNQAQKVLEPLVYSIKNNLPQWTSILKVAMPMLMIQHHYINKLITKIIYMFRTK